MARRVGVALALALLAVFVSLGTAGNGRVVIQEFYNPGAIELVANCSGFDVLEMFDAKVTLKLQLDKDGKIIKEMTHYQTDGHTTYYNSDQPEIALRGGPEGIVVKIDYVDYEAGEISKLTVSGLNYKVTLPGVGMIFHQGGHNVFDIKTGSWVHVGGPDDQWSGNIDALCKALTPKP